MPHDIHQLYIRDVVYLLRERGAEARRNIAEDEDASEFHSGRALAYAEVLSLMQNQAVAFRLSRDELLLSGFDPDVDPLDPPERT